MAELSSTVLPEVQAQLVAQAQQQQPSSTIGPLTPEDLQWLQNPTGKTQLEPTLEQRYRQLGIEEKIYRHQTLTPAEVQLLEQFNAPLAGQRRVEEALGHALFETGPQVAQALIAMGIAAGTTELGGIGGLAFARSRQFARMGQGISRLVGLMTGAAAGSEINQQIGLESDSYWNLGLAALFAAAGQGLARIPKSVAGGTEAAHLIRAQEAEKVMASMPMNAMRQEIERELDRALPYLTQERYTTIETQLWNRVRRSVSPRDEMHLWDFADAIRRERPEIVEALISDLSSSNRSLADRIGYMQMTTGRVNPLDTLGLEHKFSPTEIIELRSYLTGSRDGLMRTTGRARAGALVHGHAIDRLVNVLDAEIDKTVRQEAIEWASFLRDTPARRAQFGEPSQWATRFVQARRISDIKFAMRGIDDQLQRIARPIMYRGRSGFIINWAQFERQMDRAREMLRRGRPHPLSNFVRLLDANEGGYAAFRRDLQRIKQLSPDGNTRFFSSALGVVVRTAAIGAEASGINAFSELLTTRVGRQLMIQVMEVTGPSFSPSIMAVMLSALRAGYLGSQAQPEQIILQRIREYGAAIGQMAQHGVRGTLGWMGLPVQQMGPENVYPRNNPYRQAPAYPEPQEQPSQRQPGPAIPEVMP